MKHNLTEQCLFQLRFLAEIVAVWSGYQSDLASVDHHGHGQELGVVGEARADHVHCLVADQYSYLGNNTVSYEDRNHRQELNSSFWCSMLVSSVITLSVVWLMVWQRGFV